MEMVVTADFSSVRTLCIAWTFTESGTEVPQTHAKRTRTSSSRKRVCVSNLRESVELPYNFP